MSSLEIEKLAADLEPDLLEAFKSGTRETVIATCGNPNSLSRSEFDQFCKIMTKKMPGMAFFIQ